MNDGASAIFMADDVRLRCAGPGCVVFFDPWRQRSHDDEWVVRRLRAPGAECRFCGMACLKRWAAAQP